MKGSKIIVATILSTVLHFFILTLLDTIPLISKEIPQRNLYMVDLVPLTVERPAPQKAEEPAVQQQVKEVKKEEVKKEDVKKEEAKKEEVKKEEQKQETVKKEEVKKTPPKDDEVVLTDPVKKQEKQEKAEEQPLDPEKQLASAKQQIAQKVADRPSDDAPVVTDAEKNEDIAVIQERVKRFWVIPDTLSEEGLQAVIIIEIDKNGEVARTEFEESSGNVVFDQAAIRAIKKAAPFDPPRGSVPLKIGLRFP